ncbi:MAG: mandelate racemase/muconate lactonizing enzyme family protein [Acidobacteria bacterium]|nr:MAG: mandelate racemase/muconate lactonizing enzyme family protein [Acidobacteriota bacterium]
MKNRSESGVNRRGLLKGSAAMLGGALLPEESYETTLANVRTDSRPSELKITDMRVAVVEGQRPILRLATNQGIYGLGEVRDGASPTYALMLKSRLLGENPCHVDRLFRQIKQFGGPARQGGGVSGIEMALWDLAGKAYNVPVYQMLGGKFRDKIRIYADTTESKDPKTYAERMRIRKEQMGLTWLKMDLGIDLIEDIPGTVTRPAGLTREELTFRPHPFVATEVTDKGIEKMSEFVAAVREAVGMEIPLSMDHLGHIGVTSCIKLGRAFERFNLAWMEDLIPWQYTDLWKHITDSIPTPTLTGEDIYLKEDFKKLCAEHAVSKIHPDLATAGGILETKKIGDLAMEFGVPMAMHFAGSPVSCMASVHCAAATENFLALENHSLDEPWWQELVNGIEKPMINKGWITVPEGPGLGITLNDDAVKAHLQSGASFFEPTSEWDRERSWDRLWS